MKDLKDAREEIGRIDRRMAALFAERMAAARDIAAYKKERGLPVLDEKQEERVLEKNAAYMEDDSLRPYYLAFLRETIRISREYQEKLISEQAEMN